MSGTAGIAGVLAIDAGNSKTDVALVGRDGRMLATARGGPFRPHLVGAELAVAGLAEVVEKVRVNAGLVAHQGVLAEQVTACLANADLTAEVAALEAALVGHGWGVATEVYNDTFGLLRAGLDEPRGVAVVCGAGINCSGILPDGRTVRFAAVGHISGDWGGGELLWQEAMWWAARAEDGRGADTALRHALPRHLGFRSMVQLIEAVHLGRVDGPTCMSLNPVLFSVALAGDDIAIRIIDRQAEEIVALAWAALQRLGVEHESIDVVLGGGVLTAGHAHLMDAIDRLLAERAPLARTRVVSAPPVIGAALLGLDRIGADQDAKNRLRATTAAGS
ncbi:MAG: BadF/BadG/BcrA/BcrD ATPase family protein [Lapillicoccus sp.]